MPAHTYGDYVYFNNMTDTPNEHRNHFILNQILNFHITSPFKLCDDMFEQLPKIFFDQIIIIDEIKCPNCGSVIES